MVMLLNRSLTPAFCWLVFAVHIGVSSLAPSNPLSADEPTWRSILNEIDPEKMAVAGQWRKEDGSLHVAAAERARLLLPIRPAAEYDLRIAFTRNSGEHSIGAVLVHGQQQVGFEVDAWGRHLAGFQNVSGKSIPDNETVSHSWMLINNQRYVLSLQVRNDTIRGSLDDRQILPFRIRDHELSVHPLWALPDDRSLALLAWNSDTTFHEIEYRPVNGDSSAEQLATAENKGNATATARNMNGSKSVTTPGISGQPDSSAPKSAKRILLVIANHHFFYREYHDPREELERAGIQVTVAAGRRGVCRPHPGSGEGDDGGVVRAELALSEVDVDDFDAILFAGGWGASMYQFAFTGRYDEATYNGDRITKQHANRLINEFLAQKKHVAALCNGTSVLAWARVNGRSPLEGKLVCAPTREAAAGIYNGRRAQPSCRWHAEQNGARLSPAGSIGNPSTPADDVAVDGLILTGEDDPSAREMGRKLVELLQPK
jgi:putative intracellular protease/amidase